MFSTWKRLPGMVRALLVVLALDLAGVALARAGATGLFVLLGLASHLVAFWGGLEAVNWILQRSPWVRLLQALRRQLQQPGPEVVDAESTPVDHWISMFRDLPLDDRPELRRGLLRLLSGAALVFLALSLIRLGLPAPRTGLAGALVALFHFERARLAPLVVGSVVSAPLLAVFLGREDPTRGWEWLHVALASTLSVAAALLLYPELGSPPLGHYLEQLVQVALDPGAAFFGFMVGGVFWWLVGLAGRTMNPGPTASDEL